MLLLRTESHNIPEGFVGSVDILEFNIEYWVDPMFAPYEPKTIFPTEASEDGTVVSSRLSVKIEFRCPPTFDTVLKLRPGSHKRVGRFGETEDWVDGNFKVPRFLHMVVIGHEVWTLSRTKRKKHKD